MATEHSLIPRRRGRPSEYTDLQKLNAVKTYLLSGGNNYKTAKLLRIPENTLLTWRKSEWWMETMKEIQQEETLGLNNKVKNIIDKTLELVEDRLEHGDHIYDQKTGQLRRKPVVLRDINRVANDFIHTKQELDKFENPVLDEQNVMEKLTRLAKQFEDFATKAIDIKAPVEVTDVIFVEEKT